MYCVVSSPRLSLYILVEKGSDGPHLRLLPGDQRPAVGAY